MNDKGKQFYEYLSSKEIKVPNTYEEFQSSMQDSATASQFHSFVKSKGITVPESVDEFSSVFSIDSDVKKKDTTSVPPTQNEVPVSTEPEIGLDESGQEISLAPSSETPEYLKETSYQTFKGQKAREEKAAPVQSYEETQKTLSGIDKEISKAELSKQRFPGTQKPERLSQLKSEREAVAKASGQLVEETQKDITSIVNEGIGSNWEDFLSDDGVIDVSKIGDFARTSAKEYGVPEDGYFFQRVKDASQSKVELEKIAPSVDAIMIGSAPMAPEGFDKSGSVPVNIVRKRSVQLNEDDPEKSSVLMSSHGDYIPPDADGKYVAFPSLFPKDPDNQTSDPKDWIVAKNSDHAYELAKERGEVLYFDTREEADAVAEGSWKEKKTKGVYEEMYGVKPGDAAEDMLSRDDLQKSLGIAQLNADFSIQMEQLQKNIEKSSGEEIDVINKERYGMPIDEYASSIANDYKQRQESISEDYKTLEDKYAPFINEKNEFTGGPEMYQEYNSLLEEINSLAKESDDLYKNNFESFVSQNTKDVAEINNKYNRRFNRQQQEILKAYKNEYTDKAEGINPLLQERYQKAYGIALEKAMKEEERFKETKIRMGTEILFGSNSGIIASGYVNTSSYISGVANNLKSLSRAMGSDGEFWEQVAKDTDAGDIELNGFKDWINPSKLGKSISYTLGGMTPGLVASIGTGGVGAYVGAGSLATTLAAGTAGWGVESATIVQDAYDQKFKETGSATKAEDAAAKSLKGQVVLMPMYALEMVPFFGDLSTKLGKIGLDNMAARFAVGGATETVSEQFQEYGQQLFEQAIADDKDLSDAFDYASVKGFKDTFVNVAPTTLFLGGGGAALDIKTSKEDMAKSLVMKAKIGNLTDAALEQSMLKITVNQGQKFAKAFIDTQLRNGAITEDQATKATIAIDSSVATIEKGKKYNLDNKNNYILASLDLKLKVAKEKAEAESDPMMKGIADRNVKNIEKQAQKLMETGNADVAVVTYPDNSFDVLTHAEARMAMSKDDFMQPFVDGDLKIEAMGSEQKTLMDELKERSKRFKPTKQQKIFEKSIEEEKNKSRKKGILRTIGEKISKASAKRYNKRVYASLDKIYQNDLDYYEQALEDAREGEDDFQIDFYEKRIKETKSSTPEQVAQTELDLQNRYLEEEFTGDEEMGRSNQIDRVAGIERLEELLGQTPTQEEVERRQFIIDNVKDDTQVTEQEPVGTEEQGREEDAGEVQEPEVSEEEGDADSVLQEQKEVDAENKKIDEEEKRIDKEIEYLDIQIENFEEEISNSNSDYKGDVAEIKEKFKQKIADVKKKKVSKAKQAELIEDLKEEQAAELEDRKDDRDGEIEGYRDDIKQEKADKRKALNEKKKLEASRPKIKEAPKSKKKAKEPSKKEEVKEPAKEKEETAGTTEEELSAIEQELEKQKGGIFSEKRKRKKLVKAVRNGIKAISKALPNVKIKLHKNNQEFVDAGVTGERKEGYDLSAGIYDPETKTIHINLELADVRDVAHEVFHAFLLDNLSTNEEAAVISKRLVDNLKKIEGNNTSLIKELEDHANKYKEQGKGVMTEEMIAEFVGIISENYNSMSARGKRAVVEFLNSMLEVARKVNPEISDLLPSKVSGNEVVDMLTAIGEKVAKGEEIEQADVKELDLIKEAPYEGGDFVEVNPEGPKTPQPRQSKADNIYEDVPFSKKLPIVTLQAFANKVKGKLFAVTSDATGLGFDSKGDRIDGGFGYSSITENVDEGVGFASLSPDVAKKTISKIAKRFKAGEKIGIMIMVQNPSATIGNYYGGKYLGRGLALLKKTNEQAYSEVINGVQKILDENKTVKKDLKKKNKTSNKIMELVSSPEKYSETEFAKQWILDTTFNTRRILLKTLFIKSQQTRVTKKTNKAKLALKDAGFDMQSFLMEYGDIKLLGENNLREDNGGFVVGGFEMEVPKDIPAIIEELNTRGIEHPQFNGKIPSNGNNYMFDGLYPIQDNFVGYVKPETQIIEGLKEEADAAVRDRFQNETSYKDEVVTGDAETNPKYVEENERGYTDLKSGPKIKFKEENPYLLEPKTPGVVASVAKGLGINIIKDIPTEGAFKSPESRVTVRQKKSAADIRKEEQKREEKKLYAKIGMTPEEVSEWKKSNKKGIKMPHPAKALEAAKKYEAGEISLKKYDQEIKKHMPIFPYKQVPTPATVEEIVLALSGDKAIKGIVGLTMSIEDGTIVSSRLDIPAYMNFGIYVDTIHGPKGKGVLGYGETVVLENVTFNSKANLALKIATTSDLPQAPSNAADRVPGQEYKANKSPFAVMEGAYKNEDTESAVKRAEEALKSDEWVQVGFNPYRHAYFYDKANSSPVVSAKEVIQVGPLVMAKGVVYGEPLEFKDKKTGLTVRFKKSEENPLGNYAMQTGEVGGVVNKSQPLRQKKVKIEPSVIKKNAIPAVNFIKNVSLKAEDGLTMNLDGTKYEGGGLVVPIASINLNQSSVKPSSVSDFISKNKGKLSNDTFKVGLYKFPEESTVSIDLNIIVPNENRKVAVEVGKMLNQESLFDLDSGENVKTGGTGKNTVELTDEQASDLAKDLAENKRPSLLTVRQKIKGEKAKQRGFFKNKFEEFKKNIAFESEEFKKNIAFDPANPTLDGLGNIPDIIKEKPEAYYEPQVYSEIKDELRYMTESQLVDSMSLDGLYGIMNASGSTNNNMGVLAAAELINRKLKDGQDVESAIIQLGRMGTTIGQLLRQFGELKKSTPAGVLYAIEKIAERNNIELTKENRSVIQGKIQDRFDIIDKIDKLQEKARAKGIKPSKLKEINKEINKLKSDLYPVDSSLRVYINKAIPTPIGKAIIQILQGNLLTTGSIVTNVFANIWQTGVLLPVNITASILELARVGVGRAFGLKSNREASISIGGLIYGAKSVIGSLPDVFRTLVWKGPKSDYQEMVRQDINTNMLGWKAWTVLIGKNMTLPVPKSGSKLDKILGSLNKELGDKKFFARTNIALSLFSQGTFGLPADIMFRMLQAGDLIFKRPWKEISLYERGKMKGLKGSELEAFIKYPSKKEYDRAIEVAKEATFQEDSTLALGSSKIVTALVEFAGGLADKVFLGNIARLLMRSQFPYVKTPANIVNWVAKAAIPQLAFAASIVYYAKGDYRKGANNFGIGVTGLMMSNAAAILVANGLAQGSGEEDENEKSRVQQMEWILFPPNTINTTAIQRMMSWLEEGYDSGDGEFMKRLEIMSNGEVPKDITLPRPKDVKRNYTKSGIPGAILGIIAGSSKAQVESRLLNPVEENVLEKLGGDVFKIPSVIAYTTQQSFLQGTYSLLNALSGSDYETKNWMDNTFKAVSSVALPNQLSVINKAEREYMPDLRSRNITESWNNMILDKTFGTDGLPVRRDMWGRPIRQTPENVSPLIYQYGLDPTRPSREEENKVMYDLYEIWDKTRDSKVYPSKEKRTHNVTYNGKKRGVYFEAENMDDYQRIVGALRLEAVENEMLKSSWSRRTDEQKVERLGQLYKVTNQKFRISLTPDLKKKYSIAKDKITVKEYKLKIIDSILQDMIKEGREIK